MSGRALHDIRGFTLVLDKVVHVSPVFEAGGDEGFQFNVMLDGGVRLPFRYPDRAQATLGREQLVQALGGG